MTDTFDAMFDARAAMCDVVLAGGQIGLWDAA